MRSRFLILFLAAFFFRTSVAGAHGVHGSIEQKHTVVVRFVYSGGEPLSYAQVKVFRPGDNALEYQNGRMDANGFFSFVPDTAGQWRIRVADGMGHRAEKTITFKGGAPVDGDQAHTVGGASSIRLRDVLLGLSVIANVFFALFLVRRTRKR